LLIQLRTSCSRGEDALVDSAADELLGEQAEPALHLVDPGRAGRGESAGETVGGRPASRGWPGLVGSQVVADQVHVQLGRDGLVDRDQELTELHRAVPAVKDRGRASRSWLIHQPVQSESSRRATIRPRQRVTVPAVTRNCSPTCLLDNPRAHASTIFDRNANACAVYARRDQRVGCSRSASVSTNSAFGRPARAPSTSPSHPARANRLRQNLDPSCFAVFVDQVPAAALPGSRTWLWCLTSGFRLPSRTR
jgi:hypothetical protein